MGFEPSFEWRRLSHNLFFSFSTACDSSGIEDLCINYICKFNLPNISRKDLERILRIFVAFLLVGLLAQTLDIFKSVEASSPYLSIDTFPNPYRASAVGEKFDVNATVYQLSSDLGCNDAAFELAYNDTIVGVTSYTLATLWGTIAVSNGAGTLQVDVSSPSGTPSGNVLLITIQFVVLIQGIFPSEYTSILHLFNVRLLGNGGEIPMSPPIDGAVIVAPWLPAPTAAFAWYPSTPRVNQTVLFDGTGSTPGWNGTGYTPIVDYFWDFGDGDATTNGYYPQVVHIYTAEGNYTVKLNITDASGFQGYASKTVMVRVGGITGDINGDGIVDIYDALRLAGHYNEQVPWPHPELDPNIDLNDDGIIDIYDALILAGHYNEHYP